MTDKRPRGLHSPPRPHTQHVKDQWTQVILLGMMQAARSCWVVKLLLVPAPFLALPATQFNSLAEVLLLIFISFSL